jgi:hypothetical protein
MNIKEVSGSNVPIPGARPKKSKDEKPAEAVKKDRVELSTEAQSLFETEQSKRMAEIQKNIAEGYYARHEVMVRVVDALLKDLLK